MSWFYVVEYYSNHVGRGLVDKFTDEEKAIAARGAYTQTALENGWSYTYNVVTDLNDMRKRYEDLLKAADVNGWIELRPGIRLNTAASIIEELSALCNADDAYKLIDFTTAPYWITGNTGMGLISIVDAQHLENIFKV